MISFQAPADFPSTNQIVVEVSGAFDIHEEINSQMMPNNNGAYQSLGLSVDPFVERLPREHPNSAL